MVGYRNLTYALVVAVLFIASAALAQEATWQVSDLENPAFPKQYYFNGCWVMPRADGNGVNLSVSAVDRSGETLSQSIIIQKNEFGGIRVQKNRMRIITLGNGLQLMQDDVWGYEMFYVHCLGAARHLPKEVRAVFFGYYGIQP